MKKLLSICMFLVSTSVFAMGHEIALNDPLRNPSDGVEIVYVERIIMSNQITIRIDGVNIKRMLTPDLNTVQKIKKFANDQADIVRTPQQDQDQVFGF